MNRTASFATADIDKFDLGLRGPSSESANEEGSGGPPLSLRRPQGRKAASVPHLLAMAFGEDCVGEERCALCGAPADGSRTVKEWIKSSFTDRNLMARPASRFVCAGCALSLRENCEVPLTDGTTVLRTTSAMRGSSWLISETKAMSANLGSLAALRDACLDPRSFAGCESAWAIVLADSGQKHLIYRGVLNGPLGAGPDPACCATLEGERIAYRPSELRDRIDLCSRLIAATGKPALAEAPSFRFAQSVMDHWGEDEGQRRLDMWVRVRRDPLSRLAAWLSPNREACRLLHPFIPPLSPPSSPSSESEPKPRRDRRKVGPGPGPSSSAAALNSVPPSSSSTPTPPSAFVSSSSPSPFSTFKPPQPKRRPGAARIDSPRLFGDDDDDDEDENGPLAG